jgi:hypothetical protein
MFLPFFLGLVYLYQRKCSRLPWMVPHLILPPLPLFDDVQMDLQMLLLPALT